MAHTSMYNAKSEDVLECILYPRFCYEVRPADNVTDEQLVEEINKYNQEIAIFTKDYIWHRDSLQFYPKTMRSLFLEAVVEGSGVDEGMIVPHIHATLNFGEDVGDEWFTVFLIYNLTKIFGGLIACLTDSDGEFLLIEAANALPKWSNPETCEKRVYISNGRIHVMHEEHKYLTDILSNIFHSSGMYKLPEEVQYIIRKRISIYPGEIRNRRHKAKAYLPEKAIFMLQQEPGLIAPAIRMLVHSDPFERKASEKTLVFLSHPDFRRKSGN